MADFAATCLDGDALRWYAGEVEDAVQGNWKKLQQALLYRYPPPSERSEMEVLESTLDLER